MKRDFHTFHGLTNDCAYDGAAFFPIVTEGLSDDMGVEDWNAFASEYQDY
jgi:hypothetical protein